MITIKNTEAIAILREGGKRLAQVLKAVEAAVRPGVSAHELDALARKLVLDGGDTPSFLNYKPKGAPRPYPASLCVSVNDEVVHGVPNESKKVLKEGDIVSLDMGLIHNKMFVDSAITIGVGKIDPAAEKLIAVTQQALVAGIAAARSGSHVGDVGYAIEHFIKPYHYGIVRELAGHGVGFAVHEDPYIPNFGKRGKGAVLKSGMVIAIEPMVNEGKADVRLDEDGFTFRTVDGKRSAHFEHTLLITDGPAEVLTAVP